MPCQLVGVGTTATAANANGNWSDSSHSNSMNKETNSRHSVNNDTRTCAGSKTRPMITMKEEEGMVVDVKAPVVGFEALGEELYGDLCRRAGRDQWP